MKRVLVILCLFGLITVLTPLIGNITGNYVLDENISCNGVEMTYFYRPTCSHCKSMELLINYLINNNCNVVKINIEEQPELALNNGVHLIPALIIGDEMLVGEFSISQVKDLIDK